MDDPDSYRVFFLQKLLRLVSRCNTFALSLNGIQLTPGFAELAGNLIRPVEVFLKSEFRN